MDIWMGKWADGGCMDEWMDVWMDRLNERVHG